MEVFFLYTKMMKSALSVSLTGVKYTHRCSFLMKVRSTCGPIIIQFNTEIRAKQLLAYLFCV